LLKLDKVYSFALPFKINLLPLLGNQSIIWNSFVKRWSEDTQLVNFFVNMITLFSKRRYYEILYFFEWYRRYHSLVLNFTLNLSLWPPFLIDDFGGDLMLPVLFILGKYTVCPIRKDYFRIRIQLWRKFRIRILLYRYFRIRIRILVKIKLFKTS